MLATDFSAQDTVIELDIPANMDGDSFYIVWGIENRQHSAISRARAGTHCYELRRHPQWQGLVKAVAITLPNVPGRIKKATFFDEIDMFLEPERIAPTTINFLTGHALFTWSWNTFLLIIPFLSALWLAKFKKKPLVLCLALGFLVSWSVMDVRTTYDHLAIMYKKERYQQGMFPLTDVKAFADRASEIIGRDPWGIRGSVDGVYGSFLRYRLAEQQYVPDGSQRPPSYWITLDPKGDQVLLHQANYYLVKNHQP